MAKAKKRVVEYLDRQQEKVPRTVRFPTDVWEQSAAMATKTNISHNAFIVAAVRKVVTEEKGAKRRLRTRAAA